MSSQRDEQYMSIAKSIMNALKTSVKVSKAAVGGSQAKLNTHATSDLDVIYAVHGDPIIDDTVSRALAAILANFPNYKSSKHTTNPRVIRIKIPNLGPGDIVYKTSNGFDHELRENKHYRKVNL